MVTNRFAAWIGSGLLLFDAWVIHRGENLMCLLTDSSRYCHSWADSPGKFTALAVFVVLVASGFFLLPFLPGVGEAFREAVKETGKEMGNEGYAEHLIRSTRARLDIALAVFLVLLAVVIILLLQRWGLV